MRTLNVIRALLLAFSTVGTVSFGTAFVTSLINPGYVEELGRDLIRRQVERKVHEKIDSLGMR